MILIKGFWILEQSSPKSCELIKKYHEDIFFHPKKFSRIDPSINEPLKQYIDLGLNRLCSRVLAATVILKPRSTLILYYCTIGQSKMFPPWKMFRAPPQSRRRLGQPVRRTPAKGISLKAIRLRGRAAPSTGGPTNRRAVSRGPWSSVGSWYGHQTLSRVAPAS